ncbi:hypothetical protein AUC70_11700 [Methyloceanibacter stevinii]|uniref:Bacteriophage tail tape measure N-terminal domain-containing protein n=1 Tax=Methyloceanibacter stevinii TaxID=1774970 RepID=A0A1E3VJ39_9HYPH|nr:phage tail length tape measure family protein [Methyloceanibacter stevinii]ODR93523.1 hypothetical protein AUC70_11700 [Methyloceanibacter stevinii]
MAMRVSLVIDGNAKGAAKAAKETGTALVVMGDQAEAAAGKLGGVGGAARGAGEQFTRARNRGTEFFGGASKGARLAAGQMQNLQFQIQDLAQGLATGQQNPFTLIVQQGSQISQIFGPSGNIRGALAAIGGGIATFVTNPLNLAVVAIAAAAAAAQAFLRSGVDVQVQLEAHEDLIDRIATKYREAAEGAQDYGRETVAALQFSAEQNVRELERALADASGRIDFVLPEQAPGEGPFAAGLGGVGPFLDVIDEWNASIREGTPNVREFRAEVVRIANALPEDSPFRDVAADLLDMTDDANEVASSLDQARDAAKGLSGDTEASARALGRLKVAAGILKDLEFEREQLGRTNEEQEVYNNLKRAGVELNTEMGASIADTTRELVREQEALERAKELEDERARIQERAAGVLDQVRFEADLLAATNAEREVANNLRAAGVDISSQMGQQIADETARLYEARTAQENFNNSIGAMGDIAYDAFDGLILQQESWQDTLANSLQLLARMALQASLLGEGPLASAFGTGAGGPAAGGLIGALFGGARAVGGPVETGRAYLVGERGPEYFVPGRGGAIVPNAGSGGGPSVSIPVSIDARGADDGAVARLESAVADLKQSLPSIVVKTVAEARSRRTL